MDGIHCSSSRFASYRRSTFILNKNKNIHVKNNKEPRTTTTTKTNKKRQHKPKWLSNNGIMFYMNNFAYIGTNMQHQIAATPIKSKGLLLFRCDFWKQIQTDFQYFKILSMLSINCQRKSIEIDEILGA